METASTRLLDVLRRAHGGCTDYRAGKLLGTTTAAVSRWRTGKSHMSTANVAHACQLAGLSADTWEWNLRIAAEREKGPDGDLYREAVRDLETFQAGGDPSDSGLFALLTRGTRAAAIVAAALLVSVFGNIGESKAGALSASSQNADILHIMSNLYISEPSLPQASRWPARRNHVRLEPAILEPLSISWSLRPHMFVAFDIEGSAGARGAASVATSPSLCACLRRTSSSSRALSL